MKHLRGLVHKACPEAQETIKWNMPFFEHHGLLCHMAAFKAHCAFGFWRGDEALKTGRSHEAMGQAGRITSRADLPADAVIIAAIGQAAALNEAGVKPTRAVRAPKPPAEPSPAFQKALSRDAAAKKGYASLMPGQQREYCQWIDDAKTEATRDRRLAEALEWLADGKPQNWKYLKK